MFHPKHRETDDRDEESPCEGGIREDRSSGSEEDEIPPVQHQAQTDSGEQQELCGKGRGVAGFGVEETDMDTVSQGESGTPEDIRQSGDKEDRKGNRHRGVVRGGEGEQEDRRQEYPLRDDTAQDIHIT